MRISGSLGKRTYGRKIKEKLGKITQQREPSRENLGNTPYREKTSGKVPTENTSGRNDLTGELREDNLGKVTGGKRIGGTGHGSREEAHLC